MIAGQLEIQLLANMARLQTDMDKAKRTVSGAVDTMNRALGTIGIGVSVAGLAGMVKGVIDAGDKLNDLRKISGLTVEQLGGLEKQAKLNGSSLDQVARAVGVMSKNMYAGSDAFKALGIQTLAADGGLRDVNAVLLDVADRFSRMKDGAEKSALANQIFGKSGRDLIPMLSEGRAAMEAATASYAKNSGMTQKLAEDSDRFNDILTMLGGRVTAVKNSFVGELLPTLINIGNAMLTTTEGTNKFSFAAQVVVPVLKGLALAGYTVVDTFRGMGREIGARAAQLTALANMDFSGAKFIGSALAEDNAKARAEFDKFFKTIMDGESVLQESNSEQKKMLDLQMQLPASIDKTTSSAKLYNAELYKLKQAQLEVQGAREIEYQKLKQHEAILKRAESVTQSVATKQEIYNKTLEELNRLRPYLSVDAYTKALQKAEKELKDVTINTRTATDEVSQMWIQAGRNIQNALGNMVFDFFNGGLDDMVRNVKNAVLRIVSEFAGLRIAQTLGLTSLFALPGMAGASTGAAASSGLGLGGMLNIGSMGTSLMSMFSGGFGSMGLIGGGLSSLGAATGSGSLAAFGGGLAGDAIGGLAAGGFSASAASAASMGAAFAAVAGPAIAIAMASMLGKALAGDKQIIGGKTGAMLNYIPIIGVLSALFGHGPYKFRQQSLQGTAGANGFDGSMTDVYRSKGGLFASNRHKEFINPLNAQMNALFDQTIRGFSSSVRDFSENMGISTDIIDTWSMEVQIKSEKGKKLTEEAVSELLESFGNEMARSVIPGIDELSRAGESAYQTLKRLNNEFESLTNATTILGFSIAQASEIIKQKSYEQRTAFIDLFGGLESFNSQISFFMQNFLTPAERLAPMAEALGNELNNLGIVSSLTNEQFKALIQSYGKLGGINDAQLVGLMALQQQVLQVNQLKEQTINATDELIGSETSLASLRQQLAAAYNKERNELQQSVDKFKQISQTLRDFRDSLALSELSPLTPAEQLREAADQFNRVRLLAEHGDAGALERLPSVAQAFLQASQTYNASSAAYISDFNLVQAALEKASLSALSQSQMAQEQLNLLEDSVGALIDIDDGVKTTNELIRQIIALQQAAGVGGTVGGGTTGGIDAILQQLSSMVSSGASVIDQYNYASQNNLTTAQVSQATGYTAPEIESYITQNNLKPLTGSTALYTPTVSDQDIIDYVNSGATLRQIYEQAIENDVSSARLASVTGWSQQDILDWVAAQGDLAAFDTGTDYVPKTGIALLHKGEAVQPATMGDEIKSLRQELAELRREQAKQMADLINVTAITNKQNAETIVKSHRETVKSENWNRRAAVNLR